MTNTEIIDTINLFISDIEDDWSSDIQFFKMNQWRINGNDEICFQIRWLNFATMMIPDLYDQFNHCIISNFNSLFDLDPRLEYDTMVSVYCPDVFGKGNSDDDYKNMNWDSFVEFCSTSSSTSRKWSKIIITISLRE